VGNCCCGGPDTRLTEVLKQYKGQDGVLLPLLQEAQGIYGYLPEEIMIKIADHFEKPYSEVYGVASFYSHLHLRPRGDNIIRVCMGTVCQVMGGGKILEKLFIELKISPGETTADRKFTLESPACFGACSMAPVMKINDDIYGRLTPDKVTAILAKYY